jgi:hypothetical protein
MNNLGPSAYKDGQARRKNKKLGLLTVKLITHISQISIGLN